MLKQVYNPDVLTCIANLSSDEVFTPPLVVNQMLDTLPKELWSDEKTTFLDPVSKSGVFLREITKRLIDGLESKIPNLEERIEHILRNQVFGIGITELTSLISRRSLYCSKYANGKYSIVQFDDGQGNLKYFETEHTWEGESCKYCGVSKVIYDRGEELESYSYSFIHTENPEKLFNMKFDVIIGNPPYQMNDGGGTGKSAKPIYNLFIENGIRMNPNHLIMITPSRWFVGGKGLNSFRKKMLSDRRIKTVVDYENSQQVFPGVDIAGGVSFFHWNKNYSGKCLFINKYENREVSNERFLDDYPVLIRHSISIPIIEKIKSSKSTYKGFMDKLVSIRRPFGIPSNYTPKNSGVPCMFTQKIGKKFVSQNDYTDVLKIKDKWKLLAPFAPIAGQTDFSKPIRFFNENNTHIVGPGVICSESLIVLFSSSNKSKVENFRSYLNTKIFRFLLLQMVISQNITRSSYGLVPNLISYENPISDDDLMNQWNITDEEWNFIDSKIS